MRVVWDGTLRGENGGAKNAETKEQVIKQATEGLKKPLGLVKRKDFMSREGKKESKEHAMRYTGSMSSKKEIIKGNCLFVKSSKLGTTSH